MRKLWFIAAGLLSAAALSACGGGGGSSGGPTPPLTASVKVNGQAATAQSTDQYAVKPGDTVEITPNQSVTWTSSSSPTGISTRSQAATAVKWSAQLINDTTTAATYTVNASASADAASSKSLKFVVAGGDARNGSYKVYSTSGSRYTLALNFDGSFYAFTGSNAGGADASGTFAADATQPGTYVFNSERIATAANTARFRVTTDTVVGAFPFSIVQKTPVTFEVRPFFASRALIKTQASLDGVYNRFGIQLSATGGNDSQIAQMQISGGGTVMKLCNDFGVYRIDNCPAASVLTYDVRTGQTDDTWAIYPPGGSSSVGSFGMAPLGGAKVYLTAGFLNSASTDAIFRIGVPESTDWPAGQGYGSATAGSWGAVNVKNDQTSTRIGVATDGTAVSTQNVYATVIGGPTGMRTLGAAPDAFFAMQGARLFVIVGAARPSNSASYMQLNLMD